MRSKMFVPTLCVTLLAGLSAGSVLALNLLPVAFDVTESALSGTVACNGGQAQPIEAVDASISDDNGGLNDVSASSLSADACRLPLYTIQTAQDASYSADTDSSDVGNGGNGVEQVSLLGGILTYEAKTEYDLCAATASGETDTIHCQDATQIQNLVFAGEPITGTFTQTTTFDAVDAQVQLSPRYCTGVALFTGSLTVNAVSQQQSGSIGSISMAPIALQGTLSCVGLPLGSMTVNLQDTDIIQYQLLAGSLYSPPTTSLVLIFGASPPPSFIPESVANPNQ
ncbi:MAG TPA: hypothetical protein VME63_10865 [Dyella sp.]|uniref:hypothetical protein n=1 Tax=Dyella sp. TaxID=1869338 RepID=UPI002CC9CAAF|nr:hypothetical protein [Dyella sp.]HTV85903.1 hypothetical protein [Dyella sp.]